MANPSVADQPSVYTMAQMKDLAARQEDGQPDFYQRMRIGKSQKGAIIVLPLIDLENENAQVRYIFDGRDLWHRADTKAAQVLRRSTKQVVGRG